MITPKYVPGTSLYGYFNQLVAANAFPSRFMFASQEKKYTPKKTADYIDCYLTETMSGALASSLGEIIPDDTLEAIKKAAEDSCRPFVPSYATYMALHERHLKYCPECMKSGQHYYYQQMVAADKCRRHDIMLESGCPVCGAEISPSIEVTNLDAYVCPSCFNRFAGFLSAPELTRKLISLECYVINDKNNIVYREDKGYLAAMEGAEEVLKSSEFRNIINEYLKTGLRPDGAIEIKKKGDIKKAPLRSEVFNYTEGMLSRKSKQIDMAEFIVDCEMPGSTPKQKASAYLIRKYLGSWNPKRMNVVPLRNTISDIKRALKNSGVPEEPSITAAVLKAYISALWEAIADLYYEKPGCSSIMMMQGKMIPEISFAMMILEDKDNYFLYLYEKKYIAE